MTTDEDGGHEVVAGRYVLERELGRGGSAVVYRARDLHGDAWVALKVLHQEFSGSRTAERFAQEIRLLERFEHPGILTVTDAGEWQGRPFYVMPYVDGETLQQRLRRERRLPLGEVVRIGQRLCEALAYAHAHKVVHRDVKPANVMLSGESVYLTDFGIAKALEPVGETPHSTTGVARGTRAYMSPEQAAADRDLDHRSDIFSLGCVLYELIAGQNPYQSADETRMLMRRMTDAPDPLRRHRDDVPAGLEAAVMKALAREPADRWQGVGEMAVGLGERGAGSSSRRRWRTAGVASSAGLSGVLLIWTVWASGPSRNCDLPGRSEGRAPRVILVPPRAVAHDSLDTSARVSRAMRDAVLRWQDVSIIDAPEVNAWSDRRSAHCAISSRAGDLLIAGRSLPGLGGDSAHVEVRVVGAHVDARGVMPDVGSQNESAANWTTLIRTTLRDSGLAVDYPYVDSATTTFSAWHACSSGWSALASGLVDSAMSSFHRAATTDQAYGCPVIGLVVSGQLLRPEAPGDWRTVASRALASRVRWTPTETAILSATIARAESRFRDACPVLADVSDARRADFLLRTLVADCIGSDSTVLQRSDGSLAFRSSWMEARRTLLQVLDRAPEGFTRVIIPRLARISPTAPSVRWGWMVGDNSARYGAYPAWSGDTISLAPRPRQEISRADRRTVPATMGTVLLEGKRLQVEVASRWVARAPTSGAARFAYATALELIGRLMSEDDSSVSALRELDHASVAPDSPVSPLELFEARARMLLKAGRLAELTRVIDSALILADGSDVATARVLGPMAVLTGRLRPGIRLIERLLAQDVPVPLSDAARRQLAHFVAYSSIGCCAPMLDSLQQSIEQRLAVELDETTRSMWQERLLARWVSLAAPCRGYATVLALRDSTDVMVRIQRALARGNVSVARQVLRRLNDERRQFGAGDIAVDYVVQEAHASLAIGDTTDAKNRVQAWLAALPVSGALELRQVSQAGAIPRLLRLATIGNVRLPATWASFGEANEALRALGTHSDTRRNPPTGEEAADASRCTAQPLSTSEESYGVTDSQR